MSGGIYIPLSGALIQERCLDILANNLANVNTTGFKEDRPVFEAMLANSLESGPEIPSMGLISQNPLAQSMYKLNGTLLAFSGIKTDFSPGIPKETGNTLDLAILGNGFFSVEGTEGMMYTRNGSFTLSPEGELVTKEGFPVLGENGVITIGEGKDISISPDGTIAVDGNELDRLRIVDFPKPYPLRKVGGCLFGLTTSPDVEKTAVDVQVQQGFLEQSNVNIVREMVRMIEVNRTYQAHQKVIQTAFGAADHKAVTELGKLT